MYYEGCFKDSDEEPRISNPRQLIELSNAIHQYFEEVQFNDTKPKDAYQNTLEQFQLDSKTSEEFEKVFNRSESGFNAIKLLEEINEGDPSKTFELIYGQTPPKEIEASYSRLNINLYLPESFFNTEKGELGTASAHNSIDTHKECLKFIRHWYKSRKKKGNLAGLVAKINPKGISRNIPQNLSPGEKLLYSMTDTFMDDSRVLLHETAHVLEHYIGSNIDYSSELFAHMLSEIKPFKRSFQRAARENYATIVQRLKQRFEQAKKENFPKVIINHFKSNLNDTQRMFDQVYHLDPSLVEKIKKLGHDQEKVAFMLPYIPSINLTETLNNIREYLELEK